MTEHPHRGGGDLGLSVPIAGVQLIEASAGTGKTFTLATLYTRLVIECALPVAQILAVTFTEAATQELRQRLRERLALAQRIAEGAPTDADDEAQRLTASLVRAALEREDAAHLVPRLRQATEAMDLAPIHTIHGFCHRALVDHALEAGQPLAERTLVENEAELRAEVATDFWRLVSRDADTAPVLLSLWSSPAALAEALRELLALDALRPEPAADDGRAEAALVAARAALAAAFAAHGDAARACLREALAAGAVNKAVVKDEAVDPVWQALAHWLAAGAPPARDPATDKLGNYASAALRAKTNKHKPTPASPLFDAIAAWADAKTAAEAAWDQHRIALIHRARDYARERLAALKYERGLLGFDDMIRGVADALAGERGGAFAACLRRQYRVALLDEFQDTDPQQWAIFRRLFAESGAEEGGPDAAAVAPRALFLIGDPKQAIYRFRGGDVYTYLAAARTATGRHALARNFRSRPRMLAAVEALFTLSGAGAFAQDGIEFIPVEPGVRCSDAHFQRDGRDAPALHVQVLPELAQAGIDAARERASTACVAAIHDLLDDGLAGRARIVDRQGVPRDVEPGDIAVLVPKNDDALRIQQALAAAGIPSVAAGRSSVYATEEAEQLRWLFHALLAPADDERLRAVLATPLLGLDAAQIAALDDDESAHRGWQDRLQAWRLRVERHGPLALLGELCAEQAPRLLRLVDGERRLSNVLQLAEELQAARTHALGLAGVLDTLERRMLGADDRNDAELLRLESDAARVKILTLHKSKGLEFEFVFLPFVATAGNGGARAGVPIAKYHDGERRVAQLYPDKDGAARRGEAAEERAEALRLLYVGLTRARLATWLAWGAVKDAHKTALAWLLHRQADASPPKGLDAAAVDARLATLAARAPEAIAVAPAASALPRTRLRPAPESAMPVAAVARRVLARDWWVYSFSQLAREESGVTALADEERGAGDELDAEPALVASRFAGARFGNALHTALEHAEPARWRDWRGESPPDGEYAVLAEALRDQGYASDQDLADGLPLLTRLVARTLNVRLPEGARLAELPRAARRDEMEFHFALAPTRSETLLALLHEYDLVRERQAFGARRRLEGLLTGRIDLVYTHAQRYYVVDYKSNQLTDYDAPALEHAVREHEYDLQYVLYTLALHRWLRFRRPDYDYDAHFGGVRYLFCRGLDPDAPDAPGIHAWRLPRALVERLDALLAPPREATA